MTGEQYIESIRKIPMEIYMFGKKVENPVDNPILRPSLNSVRMTYDLAQMPEYQDLMTAISPETGERINRFTHIHRSTEDLRNKVKMQRLLGQKTAACFQRCVGMDAFNAEFGGVEALTVFDHVFVPNDRIFMNGETEFAGMLVERFAGYHRQSYGGCKVGVGDVLIGAAAVAADYNGAAKASHIKDIYASLLTQLTQFHRTRCPAYGRLLQLGCPEHMECTVENTPMLPVSIFKELELRSVPEEEIFKTVTSSGTTGQQVSKIFLDADTSAVQQQALSGIMADLLGEHRLPCLVLDSKRVLRDRAMFSARGAGALGFSVFGSKTCYALDEHMELDLDGVRAFLEAHQGEPIFLFGFTYIIWRHVIRVLEERGETLSIPKGILLHGGGWKKLANEAVSPQEFKARIHAVTGIEQVRNYYGMAEQTGCIYLECPQGHLHASIWSDVVVRRWRDYSPCDVGEPGLIQVLSPLPHSYPGHSLLTEDLGVLLGEDDCPCGRAGKYFQVTGRAPRAEVRGCSDTYEG